MVPTTLHWLDNGEVIKTKALVDSGCTGSCIDREFVQQHGFVTRQLPLPVLVYNADGTINNGGSITEVVELRIAIQDHAEKIELTVTTLDSADIFLGFEWLK